MALRQKELLREQDLKDLESERAGVENGRINRFFGDDGPSLSGAHRDKDKREADTARQILLTTNMTYARQYRAVMDQLIAAEAATAQALASAGAQLDEADADLAALRGRAARLEDGRIVFKDAEGRVRDEDGNVLSDIDPDSVLWPETAPSYEDWQQAHDHARAAQDTVDRVREYQVDVLGRARDRMSDQENPPSQEELDGILDEIETQMPLEVQAMARPEEPEAPPRQATSPLNTEVPEL
ncbi:MAG: hypothetical protein AAGC79_11035 [Pseudomonadota bacterium]